MGWFWDKQPPSVRLGSRAHRRNGVLYQGGDERKRMKGSLSYLADDKKNDNAPVARTACARARAQAHPPNKFVWKVTEVSHCHYAARCCHFIVSHQSITQTNVCLRARTRARCRNTRTVLPSWQKHKKKSFQRTAELQNLRCFNKTNCLFSCDEAPTAGANEYKHRYVGSKD